MIPGTSNEIAIKTKNEDGNPPWHVEGYEALSWVLIDFVDVVVHLFDHETRNYYAIDKLWKDAEMQRVETNY